MRRPCRVALVLLGHCGRGTTSEEPGEEADRDGERSDGDGDHPITLLERYRFGVFPAILNEGILHRDGSDDHLRVGSRMSLLFFQSLGQASGFGFGLVGTGLVLTPMKILDWSTPRKAEGSLSSRRELNSLKIWHHTNALKMTV